MIFAKQNTVFRPSAVRPSVRPRVRPKKNLFSRFVERQGSHNAQNLSIDGSRAYLRRRSSSEATRAKRVEQSELRHTLLLIGRKRCSKKNVAFKNKNKVRKELKK